MKALCHILSAVFIISMTLGCQRTVLVESTEPLTKSTAKGPVQPLAPGLPIDDEEVVPWKYDEIILLQGDDVAEELGQLIELREYKFEADSDTGKPEVSLRIFNRHHKDPILFEIRTLFYRADGSLIDAASWSEAKALPRQSFRYQMLSFSPFSEKELVQIRNLRIDEGS